MVDSVDTGLVDMVGLVMEDFIPVILGMVISVTLIMIIFTIIMDTLRMKTFFLPLAFSLDLILEFYFHWQYTPTTILLITIIPTMIILMSNHMAILKYW